MSKSAALSTRVKHLSTRQSIDLKVDALHQQLYLLTPSQPNQKLFAYLHQIFADQIQEVSYTIFIDQYLNGNPLCPNWTNRSDSQRLSSFT